MRWTTYKVVLRLLTPLHVGAGQVGNVQRARPFVIGKTLWGALTARITRDTRPGADSDDYRQIGNQINKQLAFSYFYPSTGTEVEVWPWGDTDDEFSWLYLNTYASTALDYDRKAAQDGSLHEVEFIAPATRDGDPVNLVGYVFERADCNLPWKDTLPHLQLGGERTYGWGRVCVKNISPDDSFFAGWKVSLDGDRPVLRAVDEKTRLLAHAVAHGERALKEINGAVEPLVGRETKDAGEHGKYPIMAHVCWVPGASVQADTEICIARHGLWQSAGG